MLACSRQMNTTFEYKGRKVVISKGYTSRGIGWTPRVDGVPVTRQGVCVCCSGSIWAAEHAKEFIDAQGAK